MAAVLRLRTFAVSLVVALLATLLTALPAGATVPVERHHGADVITAAVAASAGTFDAASAAVLANGAAASDALPAGALAVALDGPLLLVERSALPPAVADELDRLSVTEAWIVGGEAAVDQGVADAVAARGISVHRIAGADRFATATAVAHQVGGTEALLALGTHPDPARSWADALVAGSLTATPGHPPLLLTERSWLPPTTGEPSRWATASSSSAGAAPSARRWRRRSQRAARR